MLTKVGGASGPLYGSLLLGMSKSAPEEEIGFVVATITATDGDEAPNNVIVYSIGDQGSGLFAIDANTGVLTVSGRIDRDSHNGEMYVDLIAENTSDSPTVGNRFCGPKACAQHKLMFRSPLQ